MLKTIFWSLFRAVNCLVPKNSNKLVFSSRPDYADNAYAFYRYMVENHSGWDLVWIVNSTDKKEQLLKANIKAYLKKELSGLYQLMSARYLIETHGQLIDMKCRRQVLIELWHGKSVKATGLFEQRQDKPAVQKQARYPKAIDHFIASSGITRSLLAAGFGLNPQKVVVTGQPRNDRLLREAGNLAHVLGQMDRELNSYSKVILYVPTFRSRQDYTDGRSFKQNQVLPLEDYEGERFARYLDKHNMLFLVKMHPAEEHTFTASALELPGNIKLLTTAMFGEKLVDLYDCLHDIDLLITDYSSLSFDYLLLDRPLIFVPVDIKEYKETRGFVLEPYDFWAPGPKVTTLEQLTGEIDQCIDNPAYYCEQRKLVNRLINKYSDADSARRVFGLFGSSN